MSSNPSTTAAKPDKENPGGKNSQYPQSIGSDLAEAPRMKRVVGLWNSFAMGYADVGADIYVALGLIAFLAMGASPIAFLLAAITYVTTGMCYAELASTYPVAGGAQFYSLRALGHLHGFIAGWGLMLDYTIDIALFALVSTSYFGSFLNLAVGVRILLSPTALVAFSLAIITALIALNLYGIKQSANFNLIFVVINIVTMGLILVVGLPLIVATGAIQKWLITLTQLGTVPSWNNFIYATSLAMVSYIGIESISQAAEETKYPKKVIPTATKFAIVSVVLLSVLLSLITVTLVPATIYTQHQGDEAVTVAQSLSPYLTLLFAIWVAFVGFAICYVSTNTGVIGVSRVTYSMSRLRLFPRSLARLSRKRLTPYVTIILFPAIAMLVIVFLYVVQIFYPAESTSILSSVAQLYNFGALIAYMYVNLSLIVLRIRDPQPRAWKVPGSFVISSNGKKYEIPVIPIIGFTSCLLVWLVVVGSHPLGRDLGFIWFAIGLAIFVIYRRKNKLPIFGRSEFIETPSSKSR